MESVTEKQCTRCLTVYPATVEHFSYRTRKKQSLDSHCRTCKRQIHDQWAVKNNAYVKETTKAMGQRIRLAALQAYGGAEPVCACCREHRLPFLAIDHVNGDGRQHREVIGTGKVIYRWLKQNGYPPGFRVLCHNCNLAIGLYGTCPHADLKI